MKILAIDIGGTKFTLALFDNEKLVHRQSLATDRDGGQPWMLKQIGALARDVLKRYGADRCGVGFGGPVQFDRQRIARSMHVAGWSDFPMVEHLQKELGIPAVIDNDANLGALGECLYGAGEKLSPFFYMTLSTGIGGGIVIDGRVYRGIDSMAGEIGHTPIRQGGPACLCGSSGCLERLCCGLWLERDHGRPAQELLADPAFVRKYVVDLAAGIKIVLMLLNPARVVIGGGLSKAGEALFGPLREEVRRQMPPSYSTRIDVRQATLGDDSVLYGAMALAQQIES